MATTQYILVGLRENLKRIHPNVDLQIGWNPVTKKYHLLIDISQVGPSSDAVRNRIQVQEIEEALPGFTIRIVDYHDVVEDATILFPIRDWEQDFSKAPQMPKPHFTVTADKDRRGRVVGSRVFQHPNGQKIFTPALDLHLLEMLVKSVGHRMEVKKNKITIFVPKDFPRLPKALFIDAEVFAERCWWGSDGSWIRSLEITLCFGTGKIFEVEVKTE